jgi:hypothetical protein
MMTAQKKKAALTHLIDIGIDEAFGDYDEYESLQSRAIALLCGDKRKRIDLDFNGGLLDLEEACGEGIETRWASSSSNAIRCRSCAGAPPTS